MIIGSEEGNGSRPDPRTYKRRNQRKIIANEVPTLPAVLNGRIAMELNAGALEQVMEEECFDTYSFPILHPDFCRLLQQYVREIVADLEERHESLSDLSLGSIRDLDALGLAWLNDLMLHVIVPLLHRRLINGISLSTAAAWSDFAPSRHGLFIHKRTRTHDVESQHFSNCSLLFNAATCPRQLDSK